MTTTQSNAWRIASAALRYAVMSSSLDSEPRRLRLRVSRTTRTGVSLWSKTAFSHGQHSHHARVPNAASSFYARAAAGRIALYLNDRLLDPISR